MREWLTVAELAREGLPGLAGTERGVQFLSEREGWAQSAGYARRRTGRGGGWDFNIALLPPLARTEYERRYRTVAAPEPPPAPPTPEPASNLTDRAARERDARLAIVAAYELFARAQRLSTETTMQIFADGFNAGSIAADPWVRETVGHISKDSLRKWRAKKTSGQADKLAFDRSAARKGKGVLEIANQGRVRIFLLAMIAHNSHLSGRHLRKLIRHEFGDALTLFNGRTVAVPPVRTIQRTVAKLKVDERVALTQLSNPDFYRSAMAPSGVGTYRWINEPNDLWMIDASPVDALCLDGRHSIYSCLDIGTRRDKLYVSRTPRASAVGLLIRKGILAWGVPKAIKTDRGSDFTAEATKRLFASLGIEADVSDAYQPQQKGHVERIIGTFQHDCSPLLPGFIGHNVTDRKAIEDRKTFADRLGEDTADAFCVRMTGAELQDWVDRWAANEYEQREHSTLGMSPAQKAALSTRKIRTVDPRALDLLLMPVASGGGYRTVTKFGVRISNYHYVVMEALPGDRVLVRLDPNDVGLVYTFDADDGRFVGLGQCAELAGLDPVALIKAKREMQAEILAETTAEVRRTIREIVKGPALIERVLRVAERDMAAAAAEAANVIPLPKRTEAHETPAIMAAIDAMTPQPATPPAPSADVLAMQAKLIAEETVVPLRTEETRHARYRRACALILRIASGDTSVSTEEALWVGEYRAGPEFKGFAKTYDFDDPLARAGTENPAASWTDATGRNA